MKRWIALVVLTVCMLSGAYASAEGVPTYRGQVVQDEAGALTVSQVADLSARLSVHSPEMYRVLVVKNAGGTDMTDYLDQVWAAWKLPGNSVLIVLFTEGRNIRLHIGNDLSRYGLNGQILTQVAREVFGPLSREGKIVEATAALAADLNRRIIAGGGTPLAKVEPAPQPQQTPAPPAPAQTAPQKEPEQAKTPVQQEGKRPAWMWQAGGALVVTGAALLIAVLLFGQRRWPVRRA